MTEFLIANMAPIIFVSMIIFLLVGFPVAFALAATVLQGASEFDITARGGCARIQQKHAQMIERGVAPDKATSLLSHKQPGCLVPNP